MAVPGRSNAAALRRVVKRREALATARPFIVATIGVADAYLYCKGVLFYVLDLRVRILGLHHCEGNETVINIPELLTQALPDIGESTRGIFRILYYSDDIVSCLYVRSTGSNSAAWLIAFNMKSKRILITKNLESASKIFVRNDGEYLFYGTHSEIGTDGHMNWVVHGYDIGRMKWFDRKMHLSDILGSEIGLTVCFELHKGYFYALSSQTSFEAEEIDWTSFYHGVRFPLACSYSDSLEKTEDRRMWRRQHQEGPINDRWTSLRLYADESTGDLKVIESRREWLHGSSRSRRTSYITDVIFPCGTEQENAYHEDFTSEPCYEAASTITALSSAKLYPYISSFSDEPVPRLLGPDDKPHHMPLPSRLPQYTHVENDNAIQSTFAITHSPLRYYDTSSNTFLDLVNDPSAQSTQQLRLRAASRKPRPPLLHSAPHSKRSVSRETPFDISIALKEMYRDQPTQYWPPDQDALNPDDDVDALYTLLNPPTHLGNVGGTSDERSLVYVTGGYEKPQALIFVGFDPGMRMVGLKRWGSLHRSAEAGIQALDADVDVEDRTVGKRAGKDKERADHDPDVFSSWGGACSWAWQEKAMYRDINLGFHFGLDRGENI